MSVKTKTKERPILFSGEMVRAILDGRKVQTRRVVKPKCGCPDFYLFKEGETYPYYFRRADAVWDSFKTIEELAKKHCPYGSVGDRLWVRETHLLYEKICFYRATDGGDIPDSLYQFQNPLKWKPSIFMPRSHSRILLEITNIRVERVADISEQDAIAEGVEPFNIGYRLWEDYLDNGGDYPGSNYLGFKSPVNSFKSLWESINGEKHPWQSNPLVWVVVFKVLEAKE